MASYIFKVCNGMASCFFGGGGLVWDDVTSLGIRLVWDGGISPKSVIR